MLVCSRVLSGDIICLGQLSEQLVMLVAELRSDGELLQSCKQFKMDGVFLTTRYAGKARVAQAIDHLNHNIVKRAVAAFYRIFRFIILRFT